MLEKHPTRREASEVEPALTALAQQRDRLQALQNDLARFGPLFSPKGEKKQNRYHDRIANRLGLIESAEEALQNGTKWPALADLEQHEFETLYWRETDSTLSELMAVYRQQIRPVLELDPSQRRASDIKDAQAALTDQLLQLGDLVEELKLQGRYQDETAEEARQTALEYAVACRRLLGFCKDKLDTGSKEPQTFKETLDRLEERVEKNQVKWRDLVE